MVVAQLCGGGAARAGTGLERRAARLVAEGKTCEAYTLLTRPPGKLSAARRRALKRWARRILRDADLSARECRAYNTVTRLQALAKKGKAVQVTLRLDTTIGWGCPCAPLVFSGIRSTGLEELFIYTVMKPGVTDIARATSFRGRLTVRGRFTGKEVDRYQWARLQGKRPPPRTGDRVTYYRKTHPLFRVSWWCLKPGRALSAAERGELRRELREAIPKNRLCRKKRRPTSAPR